jgi:hypothetical protein
MQICFVGQLFLRETRSLAAQLSNASTYFAVQPHIEHEWAAR